MTTRDDLRASAKLFGWGFHDSHSGDMFMYADKAVLVDYTKDGSVRSAELYTFFTINDMHLKDSAVGQNKKTSVISWLAEA